MNVKEAKELLSKLDDSYPAFVLLPTDLLAPLVVNYWIKLATHVLGASHVKIVAAQEHKAKILEWQAANSLYVKHPD